MNSTRAIPDCNSRNNRGFFYSKEYDLRIDIYCNLDALRTFTVMWYLNDYELTSSPP